MNLLDKSVEFTKQTCRLKRMLNKLSFLQCQKEAERRKLGEKMRRKRLRTEYFY